MLFQRASHSSHSQIMRITLPLALSRESGETLHLSAALAVLLPLAQGRRGARAEDTKQALQPYGAH
jgi:hypothetical protein